MEPRVFSGFNRWVSVEAGHILPRLVGAVVEVDFSPSDRESSLNI